MVHSRRWIMVRVGTSENPGQRSWAIVLAVFALLLLLAPVPLYVRDTRYVDCRSGRTMHELHVAGLRVSQQIQESEFSRVLVQREMESGSCALAG